MTSEPKRKPGRPPLPAGQVRARHVRVPVSSEEGRALDEWAQRERRALAALVRAVALKAAGRSRRKVSREVTS